MKTHRMMQNPSPARPELDLLIELDKQRWDSMSQSERDTMMEEQRQSWARSFITATQRETFVERKPGLYRIYYKSAAPERPEAIVLSVARWTGSFWEIFGSDKRYSDDYFHLIGSKIDVGEDFEDFDARWM